MAIAADFCLVRARGLKKAYRTADREVRAVDWAPGDDFAFCRNQITIIVGRSGSGKSTFLNLLGGLDEPTDGRIEFAAAESRFSWNVFSRRRPDISISFLFQDGGLIEKMTVCDNVELPLRYAGVPGRERRRRAVSALERVGLASQTHRTVCKLSGGERHRVGLARAIARRAELVICDEPTAALDEETGRVIRDVLKDEADRGACVVVATHDPILMDTDSFADRVLEFQNGRLADRRR